MSAPILLVSLVVGLAVSLLQALTQIQEMTISFVPKLLAILGTFIFSLNYMIGQLLRFTETLFDQITKLPN
jgi:flagellar biosynthetic protein FliQ